MNEKEYRAYLKGFIELDIEIIANSEAEAEIIKEQALQDINEQITVDCGKIQHIRDVYVSAELNEAELVVYDQRGIEVFMNRNIKAEYDGNHFKFKVDECNTVELLSFVCDVAEQALYTVAGQDTALFDEAKEALINEINGIGTLEKERILQ